MTPCMVAWLPFRSRGHWIVFTRGILSKLGGFAAGRLLFFVGGLQISIWQAGQINE